MLFIFLKREEEEKSFIVKGAKKEKILRKSHLFFIIFSIYIYI